MSTPFGRWQPMTPDEVLTIFTGVQRPWWMAGGYAMELFAGRSWREHSDIDVLLLRRDQLVVQQVLSDWQWWTADRPGALRRWDRDALLPVGVHDIWCREKENAPWRIQVMLDEADGTEWVSRRNPAVRRAVATIGGVTPDGVPYLAPEIQLFYKARAMRPKDQQDFDEVLPFLGEGQRRWLADALAMTCRRHPWLERLRG